MLNHSTDIPKDGEPATDVDVVTYGAVNLLWHFSDHDFAGLEYLHCWRNDLLSNDGTADRIMLGVRVNIN